MDDSEIVRIWTDERGRVEARRRAQELLQKGVPAQVTDVAEGFVPLGTGGLMGVLDTLSEVWGTAPIDPEGAQALVLATGSLLRGHLLTHQPGQPEWASIWDLGLNRVAAVLRGAPAEEGEWQGLLSMAGQVLGDHLSEQIAWLQSTGTIGVTDRRDLLEQIQVLLEGIVQEASPPGRAGAIVGLHQITQYAHQQRNMAILSDLSQGDPDDMVRSVARSALVRAMDANFDLVY